MSTIFAPPLPLSEFVEVEFFVACDPFAQAEEESASPELAAALCGAFLGAVGLEAFHHLLEGIEHVENLADALRPQVRQQAVTNAMAAYRRNPPRLGVGEVMGVWVKVLVPRQGVRQAIAMTAPSNRVSRLVQAPAPVATRPAGYCFRPSLRPAWAR